MYNQIQLVKIIALKYINKRDSKLEEQRVRISRLAGIPTLFKIG